MPSSLTSLIRPHDTYGRLRGLAERLGVNVHSDILPEDLCGYYVFAQNMIVIDRTLTYREKRCILVHELVHWAYGDEFFGTTVDNRLENRTNRRTAELLVDPSEYRSVETIYEGDMELMTVDLDVTFDVLDDYRRLVLSPKFHR